MKNNMKEALLLTYEEAVNGNLTIQKAQGVIESILLAINVNLWKTIGITQAALKQLHNHSDFKTAAKSKVVRCHLIDRRSILESAIEKRFTTADQLIAHYKRQSKSVLGYGENGKNNRVTSFYPIDSKLGLFKSMQVGYAYRKPEEEFTKALFYKQKKANLITV